MPTIIRSYTTPGTYSFTVPAGVTSVDLDISGARGGAASGGAAGGAGGRASATLAVTPGDVLTIVVGGDGGAASTGPGTGGSNGGGTGGNNFGSDGAGGGGCTQIFLNGSTYTQLKLCAGGGGGGSCSQTGATPANGGAGGSSNGTAGSGTNGGNGSLGSAAGGTQSTGNAQPAGGAGGNGSTSASAGGGGGGGYWGGNGGAANITTQAGGGGSGFAATGLTSIGNYAAGASTAAAGGGSATITYPTNTAVVSGMAGQAAVVNQGVVGALTLPVTPAAGDLIVVAFLASANAFSSAEPTFSGYTRKGAILGSGTGLYPNMILFTKVAAGGETQVPSPVSTDGATNTWTGGFTARANHAEIVWVVQRPDSSWDVDLLNTLDNSTLNANTPVITKTGPFTQLLAWFIDASSTVQYGFVQPTGDSDYFPGSQNGIQGSWSVGSAWGWHPYTATSAVTTTAEAANGSGSQNVSGAGGLAITIAPPYYNPIDMMV